MIPYALSLLTALLVLWVPLSESDHDEYRERGTAITDAAQKLLQSELSAAMQAGGPPTAVAYCHSRAQLMMDSITAATGVQVRRVSDRARNEIDRPETEAEEAVLRELRSAYDGPSESIIETEGSLVHYYRPILIKEPCLACHGTPGETISKETMDVIKAAYPSDRATGYKVGDLRGMWHVTFKRTDSGSRSIDH